MDEKLAACFFDTCKSWQLSREKKKSVSIKRCWLLSSCHKCICRDRARASRRLSLSYSTHLFESLRVDLQTYNHISALVIHQLHVIPLYTWAHSAGHEGSTSHHQELSSKNTDTLLRRTSTHLEIGATSTRTSSPLLL